MDELGEEAEGLKGAVKDIKSHNDPNMPISERIKDLENLKSVHEEANKAKQKLDKIKQDTEKEEIQAIRDRKDDLCFQCKRHEEAAKTKAATEAKEHENKIKEMKQAEEAEKMRQIKK